MAEPAVRLLGPKEVRALAAELDLRPTKARGQNFVVDPNTVRMLVAKSGVASEEVVLEIGPGLGSLTLGLLGAGAKVIAVELDKDLAAALPETVTQYAPSAAERLRVVCADAVAVPAARLSDEPTALVANLPYNVAVPALLESLAKLPSIEHGLVMVQKEVAQRLCAQPGDKLYGVPSLKLRWYGTPEYAGNVGPSVFWPVPRVDSGLVRFRVDEGPRSDETLRRETFAAIDAAFAQRRKTLRTALRPWAGSPAVAEDLLTGAGLDPRARGESLTVDQFRTLASRKIGVQPA